LEDIKTSEQFIQEVVGAIELAFDEVFDTVLHKTISHVQLLIRRMVKKHLLDCIFFTLDEIQLYKGNKTDLKTFAIGHDAFDGKLHVIITGSTQAMAVNNLATASFNGFNFYAAPSEIYTTAFVSNELNLCETLEHMKSLAKVTITSDDFDEIRLKLTYLNCATLTTLVSYTAQATVPLSQIINIHQDAIMSIYHRDLNIEDQTLLRFLYSICNDRVNDTTKLPPLYTYYITVENGAMKLQDPHLRKFGQACLYEDNSGFIRRKQLLESKHELQCQDLLCAKTTQLFITAMDGLYLKFLLKSDTLQPLMDLLVSLYFVRVNVDKTKLKKWLKRLQNIIAYEKLNDEDAQQYLFDLNTVYASFLKKLAE
jgi:hypothetical protein